MAVHKKGITGLKKVIKGGDPIEVSCVLGYNYYYCNYIMEGYL